MDKATAKKLIEGALPAYCEWLNSFAVADYKFQPSNFTSDEDAEMRIGPTYEADGMDVIVAELGNGEEGGPAFVTFYFDQPHDTLSRTDEPPRLAHGVQQFDTSISLWCSDYKLWLKGEQPK